MFIDYHITMDSFGQDCPNNWEEIAEYLNALIDSDSEIIDEYGELTIEGREKIDTIWEAYCSGDMPEAPKPIFD